MCTKFCASLFGLIKLSVVNYSYYGSNFVNSIVFQLFFFLLQESIVKFYFSDFFCGHYNNICVKLQ